MRERLRCNFRSTRGSRRTGCLWPIRALRVRWISSSRRKGAASSRLNIWWEEGASWCFARGLIRLRNEPGDMNQPGHHRVARALRAGGPEVVEVVVEELPELK